MAVPIIDFYLSYTFSHQLTLVIFPVRQHRLPLLLFSLCLVGVLLFTPQVSLIAISANSTGTPDSSEIPHLTQNVRSFVLDNGLTVLTKEVPTTPVVTVQVWYKVGSRNEDTGVNGIAHQLEHMMFKGTKNRPIQFGRLFSALGSDSNAFTSYDQTAYYGTVESDKLKALLTLEADRMQNSLIDPEHLNTEKRVVISELQGYENSPDYRLGKAVMLSAFPHHPYGLPVGGTKADVEKFTVEQVRSYYHQYYSPENATLVIVGNFKTQPTLRTVQELFGKIPQERQKGKGQSRIGREGSNVNSIYHSPVIPKRTPIILKEPGAEALLQAVYPLPDVNHPDTPALQVMDYILSEGRSSRIYQALVESGLAADVTSYVASLRETGWYNLAVTADPGQKLAKIDSVLQSVIAQVLKEGVTTEELNRAKAQLQASLILSNRDITAQANQLGYDQTTALSYDYTDRNLALVRKVTAQDVQRVVKKYLNLANRHVGLFEPTQLTKEASARIGKSSTQTTENFGSGRHVDPVEVAQYLPQQDLTTATTHLLPTQFTLANGLRVLLLPDNNTPTVTLNGYIQAGKEFESQVNAGLASLTADNLLNGTKTKDALTIAKTLEQRGANLKFTAYREGVNVNGDSLANDLPTLIHTLADVLQNPTFPVKELELSRKRALNDLKQELDDPEQVALRTFQQAVYPETHPFHKFATESTLRRITRQDVRHFSQQYYRPETTVLSLVGDFSVDRVQRLIQSEFGDWQAQGKQTVLKYPTIAGRPKLINVSAVIPGKTQAVTYMGDNGIDRKDPRFYAVLVLNQILGGDTLSSRLGSEVRDREGLTYGIYSSFPAGKNGGTFLIQMQTAPEDTIRAIASTRKLLVQIHAHGVTATEVETAKRALRSNYTVSLANPDELSSKIMMNEVYGLTREELRNYPTKIQAVTLNQVNVAATELLHPDNLVVVTAGPPILANHN